MDANRQQRIEEAFNLYASKNRLLPLSSAAVVLRALDVNPSEKDAAAFVDALAKTDPEKKGVTFEAFMTEAMSFLVSGTDTKESVVAAFRVFDRDGSGEIPLADLQHVLMSMGEALKEDEWKTLTSSCGEMVKYDEFVELLLKPFNQLGDPADL